MPSCELKTNFIHFFWKTNMKKIRKYFFSIVAILITFMAAYSTSAQCPPGWSNGVYSYAKAPDCWIIVKYCYRQYGITGPGTDHIEIIIDEIEYYGDGCNGFRDDAQVLNDISGNIFDQLIATYDRDVDPCPAQSEFIIKLYAGDCRTEPVFVGYQVVPGQNGYITKKYITKNCSTSSFNCTAVYTVCQDEHGNNIYTRVSTTSPPFECGTTTIYCGECSPLGYIIVQCNRFCF